MRQRHRQWLAAMALSLPFGESFSGSATPRAHQLVTLDERGTAPVVMAIPNMFLSSGSAISSSPENRFGGRAIVDEDRILGFDIFAPLYSHSVDSSKWNAGNVLEDSSPLKNTWKRSSPAWFPWIPSSTQIMALKLTELKQACAERGLKKVCSVLPSWLSHSL
jgi:hypothetical protein